MRSPRTTSQRTLRDRRSGSRCPRGSGAGRAARRRRPGDRALGAPGQAVTFLERAIEVTQSDADRAELHERAGRAATDAARREQALGHFQAAGELLEGLGDRSAGARLAARQAQALASLRRRDEARALVEEAWTRFADLGDDDPTWSSSPVATRTSRCSRRL